jgi:antitoxin VapB
MGRQLNIKSDEAFHAAHKIADNLGITTTKAVELALSQMLDQSKIDFPRKLTEEEKKKAFDAIMAAAKACTAAAKLGASSDHSYLYDENGLPV